MIRFPIHHKFNAQRTEVMGIAFVSKLEADVFLYLNKLQDLKQIFGLRLHPKVKLTDAKISMIPDFECEAAKFITKFGELSGPIWIEAKGKELATWRIKKKLWQFYGPGPLLVFKRAGRRGLHLDDVIFVKKKK